MLTGTGTLPSEALSMLAHPAPAIAMSITLLATLCCWNH